jgi:hypothetical protein
VKNRSQETSSTFFQFSVEKSSFHGTVFFQRKKTKPKRDLEKTIQEIWFDVQEMHLCKISR